MDILSEEAEQKTVGDVGANTVSICRAVPGPRSFVADPERHQDNIPIEISDGPVLFDFT
jgi:hypothetical protein